MNRDDLTYRGRRRLSDVADRAGREAIDHVDGDGVETARAVAADLAESDELLRGAVQASVTLDARANDRRKAINERGGDPYDDDVLTSLREAREKAREAVEGRVEEVVGEAVDYAAREETAEAVEVEG
jgi:hypothetical protein